MLVTLNSCCRFNPPPHKLPMSFQVAAFADDAVLPEPPRPALVVDAAAVAPAQVPSPPRPQEGTAVVPEKRKTPLVYPGVSH
jgi:hypothetical protein